MKAALGLVIALAWAGATEAACRQALVLGLDVSGSVDAVEYRLQLDGVAAALEHPEVRAAFLQNPSAPVRFMIFEWSGLSDQRQIVGWTEVASPGRLDGIAARLRATRASAVENPSTALAAAMTYGAQQALAQQCWRHVLDISGDGPGNIGAHPADLTEISLGEVTINALVIGPESRANTTKNLHNVKSLEEYYRSAVIRGPGAFVEPAQDYEDFVRAMTRKLIRELAPPALSGRELPLRVQ